MNSILVYWVTYYTMLSNPQHPQKLLHNAQLLSEPPPVLSNPQLPSESAHLLDPKSCESCLL